MYPGNRFRRYLLPPLQGRRVLYMAIIVVWIEGRKNDGSLVMLVTVLSFPLLPFTLLFLYLVSICHITEVNYSSSHLYDKLLLPN